MRHEGWEGAEQCCKRREVVHALARRDPEGALDEAQKITLPWYRVQSFGAVIPHVKDDAWANVIVKMAMHAADSDRDAYRGSACLAWIVGACVARKHMDTAEHVFAHALRRALQATPTSSRSDALFLLLRSGSDLGLKACHPAITALQACIVELASSGDRNGRYRARCLLEGTIIHVKPMDAALARQLIDTCPDHRVRATGEAMFKALA